GATRTADARELLYARQKVVVTTKAFGLQAIDLVYIDYKDVEGLRKQAREGALMGFTGKQVIHPGQVQAVQEEFSPSPVRVQWTKEPHICLCSNTQNDQGAFTFRGSMIDMPSVKQAQNIVTMCAEIPNK
uniref:Citrate lyase beta like n=1 Tax=Tetraodon nigroviridis TaxID=99883 RepID=H3C772_TETNG